MPTYQNYFPQMNSGYVQQMPMQNPYQQRMDFLQSYQQSLQPAQMSGANQQMNVLGKIVDGIEAVKAIDIPMDGAMYFFPKADGTEVYGKRWIVNEGRTVILPFKPVLEAESNNLQSEDEKSKFEPFRELTETFEKRFDNLENRIDELLVQNQTKSRAKSVQSSTKKESVDDE